MQRQSVPLLPLALTRRSFLAATGGLLVAAACGGSDGGGESDQAHATGIRGLRVSTDVYRADGPQRFAFALTKDDRFYAGAAASIAFAPPGTADGTELTLQPTELLEDGLPEGRGIYVTEAVLPEPGIWQGLIEVDGERTALPFEVVETPAGPTSGTPAPRVVSPTVADPLGVDPLCTRDPDCPLHEVSLDQLIGTGKPVAVMFATPARCTSQYCGPTLDLLLDVKDPYADRVNFVHVEVYRSETGNEAVPTFDEWGLATEPWLFAVDAGGTVTERLDGAFDRTEIRALLDRLAA